MKIFCVVGIRASGKTTTITQLLQEMGKRGYRAGTIKTVFCPAFSIDGPDTNTARHKKAGAKLIAAKGKKETALIIPRTVTNTEILRFYGDMDYVILEGDYLAPVPRLVAAHGEEDGKERLNEMTLAIVGKAAAGRETVLGLPAFDPTKQAGALMDFLERRIADTPIERLEASLPPVAGVTDDGYCRQHCRHHHEKCGPEVEVTVHGQKLVLTPEQEKLILSWQQ